MKNVSYCVYMYIMQDVCPEISNPEQDPAACEPDTDNMAGKLHTTLRGLLRLVISKDNLRIYLTREDT